MLRVEISLCTEGLDCLLSEGWDERSTWLRLDVALSPRLVDTLSLEVDLLPDDSEFTVLLFVTEPEDLLELPLEKLELLSECVLEYNASPSLLDCGLE